MMQNYPKISLVTPSFNQGQFLEATIQSILSQNYPNLEYIIIDGGSTDNSVEIINKYESQLHFWCSESDRGQYDALNKGFAHATGDIMAWLNSDDMYFPWTLKTVASIFTELPEVEWLTTLQQGYWDDDGFCSGFVSMPGYSKEAFLDGCYLPLKRQAIGWIQQESTFWRRSLWQKAGSYIHKDLQLASDFDLWSRFYTHADLYGTNSPLAGFRFQKNQKSRGGKNQYSLEAEQSLMKMRNRFSWSPKSSSIIDLYLKLRKIPKFCHFINHFVGYRGKKIVRQDKNQEFSHGSWNIQEYSF